MVAWSWGIPTGLTRCSANPAAATAPHVVFHSIAAQGNALDVSFTARILDSLDKSKVFRRCASTCLSRSPTTAYDH